MRGERRQKGPGAKEAVLRMRTEQKKEIERHAPETVAQSASSSLESPDLISREADFRHAPSLLYSFAHGIQVLSSKSSGFLFCSIRQGVLGEIAGSPGSPRISCLVAPLGVKTGPTA